jgi:hypothetical protein
MKPPGKEAAIQKPIKIIHTADFHYSRENQEKALQSLETVCNEAEKKGLISLLLPVISLIDL